MPRPELSVIIVNWNGRNFLEACLSSLRRQTFTHFEAMVVDNGSDDGSLQYIREQFPEVTLISLPENCGFQAANSIGYERSMGDAIFLLNNDTEMAPSCLEEIHVAYVKHPEAGSFACKMLYFDERNRIENCGCWITPAGNSIDIGRDELNGPEYGGPCWVFGACAGAAVYRRRLLEDIGFLDREFFVTYDDLDLSFRAQLRAYRCLFVPGATVYHRYRATMKKFPGRQTFFSQRNIEYVYVKNMPTSLMFRFALQRLVYECGSALYFAKQGHLLPFLRAKGSALRHLPSLLRKRREIQRRRVISNAQLVSMMSSGWVKIKAQKFLSAWRRPAARKKASLRD